MEQIVPTKNYKSVSPQNSYSGIIQFRNILSGVLQIDLYANAATKDQTRQSLCSFEVKQLDLLWALHKTVDIQGADEKQQSQAYHWPWSVSSIFDTQLLSFNF